MKATGVQYLQEYYGDSGPTGAIVNHICGFICNLEAPAVTNVVNKAEISTDRLVNKLELKASDPAFVRFREFIDEQCIQSLDSIYGEFSGFTSPILSQKQLSAISDMSKLTLLKHYHAISSLLNKVNKATVTRLQNLHGQWDHDILYHFITISRNQNPKFFTFWALINTTSSYGGTSLDLEVFFGLAVTVKTMLQKLNHHYLFQTIMCKTMDTLALIEEFGICIFDNSQSIWSLKFQRGGRSSDFSLATSQVFLKATIPQFILLQ